MTSPGLRVLNRLRTLMPAASRRAKNSCSLAAPAAAVLTARRSVTRGASWKPWRRAFSDSARVGRRAAVRSRGAVLPQAEPVLRGPARLAHLVVVVPQAGARAVLAGQHRHDVDVVRGVPDRDPADRVVVLAVGGEAGAVHDVAGELGPFVVGQHPVAGGGADRAVPDRFGDAAVAERFLGLLEQAGEVAEVAVAVVAERGFEFGGVAPAGDEVRVGVLLVAARAEEVVDQAGDAAAARADLADHWRIRFRTSSAAWSRSWARRMLSAA